MWHILIAKGFFGLKSIFKVSLSVWSTLWHINASQHIRTCRSVSPSCHVSLPLTLHLTALHIWLIVLRSRIFLSALFFKMAEFLHYKKWKRGQSDGEILCTNSTKQKQSTICRAFFSCHHSPTIPSHLALFRTLLSVAIASPTSELCQTPPKTIFLC